MISFHENGTCELLVNYQEGSCTLGGNHVVDGSSIFVELINLEDTIFVSEDLISYMPDKYVFTIIDDEHISIDKGYYVVQAGDIFIMLNQ